MPHCPNHVTPKNDSVIPCSKKDGNSPKTTQHCCTQNYAQKLDEINENTSQNYRVKKENYTQNYAQNT